MHKIVAVSDRTAAAAEQIVLAVGWPADVGVLVYPETCLEARAGATLWKGHRPQNSTFGGLWEHNFDWEFAVLVDEALGENLEYPGIFSWVLAHEFGHALAGLTCKELLGLHIFVQENIKKASNGVIRRWVEIPFELTYDRFALAVVLNLFKREVLLDEVERALEEPSFVVDQARLERLTGLEPLPSLPDMLSELSTFVGPYEAQLRKLWSEQADAEGDRFICAGVDRAILFN